MSALDEMQSMARTVEDALDGSMAAAAELEQQTDDLAQRFAALGSERAARLLAETAGPRLATVREHVASAQRELGAFAQDCEQVKGAGAGGAARQPGGSPSTSGPSSSSTPRSTVRLSNADRAQVDRAKFTDYLLAPEHPDNRRKWEAFARLGYDVRQGREQATDDVVRQLHAGLKHAEPYERQDTPYGLRCRTNVTLTGPNGKHAELVAVWQYDTGSDRPRLLTCWPRVHTEEGER